MRPGTVGLTMAEKVEVPDVACTLIVWLGTLPVIGWFTPSASRLILVLTRSMVERPRYCSTLPASAGSNATETPKSTLNGALPLATFAGALAVTLIGSWIGAPPFKLLKRVTRSADDLAAPPMSPAWSPVMPPQVKLTWDAPAVRPDPAPVPTNSNVSAITASVVSAPITLVTRRRVIRIPFFRTPWPPVRTRRSLATASGTGSSP